jgi:amidase
MQRTVTLSAAEAFGLLQRWNGFRATMLTFLEQHDVIVCPTCAQPALPHRASSENQPAFSYTMTYNLTGWPAAVVRAGSSSEGLPIGVQIVARPWREAVALAVAQHLETALGGGVALPSNHLGAGRVWAVIAMVAARSGHVHRRELNGRHDTRVPF